MQQNANQFEEFAFIYATPLNSAMLKSLLLFFDGIAVVAAEMRIADALRNEPEFFLPMLRSKLGMFWTPTEFFDDDYRASHTAAIQQLVDDGVFDNYKPDLEVADYIVGMQLPFAFEMPGLRNRGVRDELARDTDKLLGLKPGEGTEQELHGILVTLAQRGLIEVRNEPISVDTPLPGFNPQSAGTLPPNFLASPNAVLAIDSRFREINDGLVNQFARTHAAKRFGKLLQPVNAREQSIERLINCWQAKPSSPKVGNIILHDLEVVGPSLAMVSIDDVLEFRERYGSEHREYMRGLRRFVADLSPLTEQEVTHELAARRRELSELARELSAQARSTWKNRSRFMLGIAGAALTLTSGNLIGAALSASGSLLGLGGESNESGVLTYLAHVADLND